MQLASVHVLSLCVHCCQQALGTLVLGKQVRLDGGGKQTQLRSSQGPQQTNKQTNKHNNNYNGWRGLFRGQFEKILLLLGTRQRLVHYYVCIAPDTMVLRKSANDLEGCCTVKCHLSKQVGRDQRVITEVV